MEHEATHTTLTDVLSVQDLVRRRMGDAGDAWDLALVQRDEVWDQDRMRALLDSLLYGYPIGSLLLCTVERDHSVMTVGTREVGAGTYAAPQLVDGQQRINALYSIFTDGGYGRFYLDMSSDPHADGQEPHARARKYIAWRAADPDALNPDESIDPNDRRPIDRRHHYLDLSRWYEWAKDSDGSLPSDIPIEDVIRSIDPAFASILDAPQQAIALSRLRRLMDAWTRRCIPVVTARVREPAEVLDMFTRINRGGVPVSNNDVYFAGVKTFWPHAERSLADLVNVSQGLLNRWTALSLVSRLAVRALGLSDIVPLRVGRLTGAHSALILEAMNAVANVATPRVDAFTRLLIKHSELRQGLRHVNRYLWEDVYAWAVVANFDDADSFVTHRQAVDDYLVGATIFRYQQVLGDRWRRSAFMEALDAGSRREAFPLQRIVSVARGLSQDLRGSGQQILPTSEVERIAASNAYLLLSLAQGIDFDVENLDWDHILPAATRDKMRRPGLSGRLVLHPDRDLLNSPGNFWWLSLSANRALQATLPGPKFQQLRDWRETTERTGSGHRVWPDEQWALTQEDQKRFTSIGELLEAKQVDDAMTDFRELVTTRSRRLVADALSRFPGAQSFARDATVEPTDATSSIPTGLAADLGCEQIKKTLAAASVATASDRSSGEDPESSLALNGVWQGYGEQLTWAMMQATKEHARITSSRSESRWKYWGDRSVRRSVPLRGPDPDSEFIVAVDGHRADDSGSPIWFRVRRDSPGYATVRARIRASGFEDVAEDGESHVWIPLRVSPEQGWNQMRDSLIQQLQGLRDVIEDPRGPIA
jgi:hypothetical protein